MAIDRKSLKGGKLSNIADKAKEAKKNDVSLRRESEGGVTYHQVKDGRNVFRVLPAIRGNDPYEVSFSTMIECQVDKYNNGEPTGEKEIKRKKIRIARQHLQGVTKDVVVEYINQANKLSATMSKDERDEFLTPIKGSFGKQQGVFGIVPVKEFYCWALDSENKLGLLALKEAWMSDMIKESERISQEDGDDEDVIDADVFSDPDKGYPLVIDKEKNDKGKVTYGISVLPLKRGQDWDSYFEKHRVSDETLEELEKQKSLEEMFVNSYTIRDFELAIDGLKRFDEKHEYGIFDTKEFRQYIKEAKAEIEAAIEKFGRKEEKEEKGEKAGGTDKKEVSPKKMLAFITDYAEEEYGEDVEIPELEGEELKKWYKLAKAGKQLPLDSEEEEVEEDETPPAKSNRLDEIRRKLAEKNKK